MPLARVRPLNGVTVGSLVARTRHTYLRPDQGLTR